MKLKKGDSVKVVLGKDKGKIAKIEKVFSKMSKVLVAGANQYKRHQKARSQGQPSEIITITKPMPLENVVLICPHCKLQTRVSYKFDKNNKKIRICRKCDKEI